MRDAKTIKFIILSIKPCRNSTETVQKQQKTTEKHLDHRGEQAVVPAPVRIYTQFRPKIRCKVWLFVMYTYSPE